jgi:hypothetical protein
MSYHEKRNIDGLRDLLEIGVTDAWELCRSLNIQMRTLERWKAQMRREDGADHRQEGRTAGEAQPEPR